MIQDPGGYTDTTVGCSDPRVSAVTVRPLLSGWVPSGGNRQLGQLAPSYLMSSDHPGPIGREAEDVELAGGR